LGDILGQQHNVKYLLTSSGRVRTISDFLLFLLFMIPLLTPSNLMALNRDESYGQIASLVSSNGQDKSEYFLSQLDKYIGVPYRRGGIGEKGFDCSGFVRQVYAEFFGLDLPHQSYSQSSLPFMQKIAKDELVTGDLVFFSTTGKKKRINHVGIYLSDGRFIHAAKGGVTVSSLYSSYWKARFFVAKRVDNNHIWNRLDADERIESPLLATDINQSSRFDMLYDLTGNLSALDGYPYYKESSNDTLSLGYELTWSASIANGAFVPKFTAFQGYSHPFQSDQNNIFPVFRNSEFGLTTISNRSSDQGLNFAAAIASDENGLSLTPSFTYFDSGYNIEKKRLQRFTYGLDLEISPANQPWLLALGMQFSEYTYSDNASSTAGLNEFRSPMNMSLTYLHQLSKSAYLSFTGELAQRFEPVSGGGSLDQLKNERRSLFLFNYKY
jgi:hypothetical protein